MNDCRLILGDCLDVLPTLEPGSVGAVVTDPPYALTEPNSARSSYAARMAEGRTDQDKTLRRGGFMGKKWDGVLPPVQVWEECLCVLRPGGYLLSFGGTRTWHRLACALEDAGFEMRDTLCWLYGTGFPKGKGCLKPAWEPVLLCRKPGPKVLPLPGLDGCRVGYQGDDDMASATPQGKCTGKSGALAGKVEHDGERSEFERPQLVGRWPANVVHDGGEEVTEAFAEQSAAMKMHVAGNKKASACTVGSEQVYAGGWQTQVKNPDYYGDTGTAARFFYTAKASRAERGEGNTHPTVKPLALMRWLVRLVTPEGGLCLDPFLGSGTTALAAIAEGCRFVGVEREPDYLAIAERRLAAARASLPLFAEA